MANEPLALPQILAELSNDADFEAVYARLMTTERGRRFLAEYANRNRHAETQVLVGAIARVEAAIRGEAPGVPAATSVGALMEIAAAIDRIAGEIAGNRAQSPQVLAAIERVQDIAFVLHERPVEATLCDALDAAVREISGAYARSGAGAENLRKASHRLRALAGHTGGTITGPAPDRSSVAAQRFAGSATAAPSGIGEEDADLFQADDNTTAAPQQNVSTAEEGAVAERDETAAISPASSSSSAAAKAPPVRASSEDILSAMFSNGPIAPIEPSREAEAAIDSPSQILPPQNYPAAEVANLEQEPDDLFEPGTDAGQTGDSTAANSEESSRQSEAPVRTAATPQRAAPRSAQSDPLAAVRALSEEELIALFS